MKNLNFKQTIPFFFCAILCLLLGTDIGMANGLPVGSPETQTATPVNGAAGVGIHNTNEPISIDQTRRDNGDLILSTLDREVVKILPYKTPLDTIMRHATKRKTNSIIIEWMSVDTKPFETEVAAGGGFALAAETPVTAANSGAVSITVDNVSVFAETSTILIPSIMGYEEDGTRSTDTPLMLYVKKKTDSTLTVQAANGSKIANTKTRGVPAIPAGTELKRMGRAAQEKDVQTEASSVNPTKEQNFCQTYKCQVDETYWMKRAETSVDWSKEDQMDMAVLEWKMEMEASSLAGVKSVIYDSSPNKGDVYTSAGILRFIKNKFEYAATGWTTDDFIDLTKQAFTGNSGSNIRVLFMDSDLMADISKVELQNQRDISKGVEAHWGIEFTYIRTNFGKILCLHHEQLDRLGIKGVMIDPNYLVKYEYEAENRMTVDNKKNGTANTTADITTETFCIALKYPQCHLVINKKAA